MKPPKQNSLRANLERYHSRVLKSHGQLSVHSQSGAVRKDSSNRKRKAEEVDDAFGYRSLVRNMFSARIARQEDEEELEKIMEEEKKERLRKKAKMRKMSQR